MIKAIFNNKVFKNFSYLTLGSLLSQIIGIFTIIKITAILSANKYGEYTFMLSQGNLLFVIADLGITNIIIRTIARNKERTNDLVFNGVIMRISAVLILFLFYLIYNHFSNNLSNEQLLYVALFALINCFSHLFEIVFLGNEKMLPISIINIGYTIVWFLIIIFLPSNSVTVNFLFFLFIILNGIKASIFYLMLNYNKLLWGKIDSFWFSSKKLLLESWPYFSLVIIMTPVNYMSNNFLAANSTMAEVGYFNLSQKLMLPVNFVLGFALSSIFPNLSSLWYKDQSKFNRIVSIGFKYFMLGSLLLCFLFTIFAREVVTILFNDSYLPAVPVCQLQVWFIFLMSINSLIGTVLGAVNKEKLIFKLGVINALVSTPMIYIGSQYGALGLSYGYVISFALFGIYIWPVFKKSVNLNIENDILLWIMTIFLFAISYLIPQNVSFLYRIILALLIVSSTIVYILKSFQLLRIK